MPRLIMSKRLKLVNKRDILQSYATPILFAQMIFCMSSCWNECIFNSMHLLKEQKYDQSKYKQDLAENVTTTWCWISNKSSDVYLCVNKMRQQQMQTEHTLTHSHNTNDSAWMFAHFSPCCTRSWLSRNSINNKKKTKLCDQILQLTNAIAFIELLVILSFCRRKFYLKF